MKKYLLLALHGFLAYHATAQPFVVQTEKMNVLYVGMPNEMHIVVNDVAPERLILLPSMGEIDTIDLKSGHYLWKVSRKDSSVAKLVLADSSANNPMDTFYFRVKEAPEPIFYLFNQTCMGTNPLSIKCRFNHDAFSGDLVEIVGYDVEFHPKNGVKYSRHNKGAKFETDIRNAILAVRADGWIRFYNFTWKIRPNHRIYTSNQDFVFGKYPGEANFNPFEE
jgi:hypothetical protein